MSKAWNQVDTHPTGEDRYRCALVGLTVWAHTREWEELGIDSQTYRHLRRSFWGRFKENAGRAQWKWGKDILHPSFCCGYFLSYRQACDAQEDTFPVGMLWSGLIGLKLSDKQLPAVTALNESMDYDSMLFVLAQANCRLGASTSEPSLGRAKGLLAQPRRRETGCRESLSSMKPSQN